MEVALQGVQDYWQRYCKRHELKSEITAQGQRFISLDNNYWADYTMQELKDKLSSISRENVKNDALQSGLPDGGTASAPSLARTSERLCSVPNCAVGTGLQPKFPIRPVRHADAAALTT